MRKVILVLLVSLGVTSAAFAHSGGTNSSGCHTNHKTGDYHCHNRK
ncbi:MULTISPECIES: YHYH domain-containing protein [Vibrio]|uniref:YHYH domain-containing protein n=1 Tax=Vibrio diazotrophicus TaxID=685 RepID=A0A2J8GDQ0_VIBDI|nr:YHYH domain-containing protein [Vibrio diazotrophicus]MBR9874898.1 YHYH domain-containing protein [Vibrionaceae bacterium]PNH84123.1 YHYH domain-containing protein [Vibrio diazotrophicus]PNH84125.1 YHYH domain-containing protein [Vibrio diazotrophicus]PNI00298.1 YHYH domain-containing protein [Vibrio diazotrophicus]